MAAIWHTHRIAEARLNNRQSSLYPFFHTHTTRDEVSNVLNVVDVAVLVAVAVVVVCCCPAYLCLLMSRYSHT